MSSDVIEVFDDGEDDVVEIYSTQSTIDYVDTDSANYVDISGSAGAQGTQGTVGPIGLQGTVGLQGIQGLQGATSTQGATGTQGLTGVQGLQGLQGILGDQGIYIGASAPANTSILWADTSSPGTAMTYVLVLSQAEYDAIATKDPFTLYVVV